MRTILAKLSTCIALSLTVISVQAQTVSVSTTPEGVMTYTLPVTTSKPVTSYFSFPLINDPIYTGAVSAVTSNSITVGDTTPPWSAGQLSAASQPYFVKFLTGNEIGRVLLVTSNTPSALSLDTTDHSSQTVPLTTTGFNVAVGDSFEVFPGETLATFFGSTTGSLTIAPGNLATADSVGIYSTASSRLLSYYFNTSAGHWVQIGSPVTNDASNTILYPYSGLTILRQQGYSSTSSFMLMGRVAEVNRLVKTTGSSSVPVYDSTGYPVDMTLSQLQLTSNWNKGNLATADEIAVWDTSSTRLDSYYETASGTWVKIGSPASVNYANTTGILNAGTALLYLKASGSVTGTATFVNSTMPY